MSNEKRKQDEDDNDDDGANKLSLETTPKKKQKGSFIHNLLFILNFCIYLINILLVFNFYTIIFVLFLSCRIIRYGISFDFIFFNFLI